MVDQISRSAARLATLIAVPVAVLTGIGLFVLLNGVLGGSAGGPAEPGTGPTGPSAPAGAVATGPVETQHRQLSERQETVCRAVLSQLPAELDGQAQRPVTTGPEQNAAYGDPPIVLACGVPPARFPLTDHVYPLPPAGVCWHAVEEPDVAATVWTTVDREVPVRVTVPAAYDGPGQLVTELSGTIAETVRSADDAPSGCTPSG